MKTKNTAQMTEQLARLTGVKTTLQARIKSIKAAHANIPALRQQASDEGAPGDESAFTLPIMEVRDEAAKLMQIAKELTALADGLLALEVEAR